MKTKFTLIASLFLFLNYSFAQEYCAAPTDNFDQNFSSLSRMITGNSANEEMICLNISFHIVRNDNGDPSSGIRSFETNGIIDNLNNHYNPHNIKFNKVGHDFINSTALNNVQGSEIGDLIAINNNPNALNFYIANAADFNGYGDILGINVVITKAAAVTGVASHEVGHNLNLRHTHDTRFGVEIQDDCPSTDLDLCNCTVAGDLVCDTPPDSGLRNSGSTTNPYYVDSNCNYTKNDGYNPDTENIMSYTSPTCLRHFTNGQAIRMRDAILNSPILQSAINCNCSITAIFGKSTICSSETTTYAISCGDTSFTTSTNLQIISSTNNSITVKPINTSINEEAFVKTTINGTIYQKNIWIGKPKVDLTLNPITNFIELKLIGLNSDIHKQNITYIEWETLSTTGNATMGTAINQFNNIAHGNSTNWIINARIKVENDCGVTYLYKDITPPAPLPCDDYYTITKTQENEYTAFIIIDPCTTSTTSVNKKEKVKDKDILKAALFDIYGYQVKKYKLNNFNTKSLKHGVYIFKVQIKDELLIKKIIVE